MIHTYVSVSILRTAKQRPNSSTMATCEIRQVLKANLIAIPNSFCKCLLDLYSMALLFWDQKVRVSALQRTVCHPLDEGVANQRSRTYLYLTQHALKSGAHAGRTWKPWNTNQLHQLTWWDLCIPVGCEKALVLIIPYQDWIHLIKWTFERIVK